jgi:hypothetical protein
MKRRAGASTLATAEYLRRGEARYRIEVFILSLGLAERWH